jgi:hypothetical protein
MQKVNPALDFGQYHFNLREVNWPLAAGVLLCFSGSIYIFWRYAYLYDPPYMAIDDVDHSLAGLKGWLFLPGFALLATPVRVFLDSRELWYTFSAQQWSILAESASPAMLATIILENFYNVTTQVAAVFLIFLFFQRRHTFPRLFIYFLGVTFGFSTLDTLLAWHLDVSGFELNQEEIGSMLRQAFFVVVWMSYFKKSRRVQATFTERREKRQRGTDKAADNVPSIEEGAQPRTPDHAMNEVDFHFISPRHPDAVKDLPKELNRLL